MKVPICKLCGKAHWTYEEHQLVEEAPAHIREMAVGGITEEDSPAINKERLTDAINTPSIPPTLIDPEPSGLAVGSTAVDEAAFLDNRRDRGSGETPVRMRAGNSRTPNRRSRESYNSYMKDYMARRRAK